MSRFSRLTRAVLLALPLAVLAASCAAPGSAPSSGDSGQVVSIGVTDAGENYWNVYKEKAAAKGITVNLVNFTDYNQPNPALSQGQLQLNQFQHLLYLANYNVKNNDDLVPIGATAVYPLPLYSTKHTSVDQIPQGGQIVIPNDPTNQARALLVLQAAGLITLRGGGNSLSTPNEIESAKVEVVPVDAAQTAANLPSVDAAIVNNNYATAANLTVQQRIFADDPNSESSKPYINAFVARAEDKDNPAYLELAALYHDPEVEAAIRADLGDTGVFKTNDVADLQATTDQIENDIRAAGS
ncbi:D-methionine transport system substrate-binding protein [Pseudonocardia hierapolitana]|uniref:D-methionine transport system substrate-binding protein n=1 Tax=Pseudonocardia hierapolitana TaxID=1128676 RepID=A0A561T0N2_9PSEU|nr:MetQ/NlpA family ABC transporter substrate-binding protein [Pseudonocardia hierapolitana]TWF80688.1 D-methionine transport system substrate-binding protein [Pseudonocardia hierapolitana]